MERHLRARTERLFVELVRRNEILEVRLDGQGEVQVAQSQRLEDSRVAHVFARFDRAQGAAERQSPGEQELTLCDRLDRETMALEDRVGQARHAIAEFDLRACGQTSRRDRDVVTRCRDAPDLLKSDRVHDASLLFSLFRLPELLRRQPRAFGERSELGPGDLGLDQRHADEGAKAAVAAGDHVLPADELRKLHDALGD